jgi:hypothetical protein
MSMCGCYQAAFLGSAKHDVCGLVVVSGKRSARANRSKRIAGRQAGGRVDRLPLGTPTGMPAAPSSRRLLRGIDSESSAANAGRSARHVEAGSAADAGCSARHVEAEVQGASASAPHDTRRKVMGRKNM